MLASCLDQWGDSISGLTGCYSRSQVTLPGSGSHSAPRGSSPRCPYVMCGSRVGFWEGHAATELQPYPLQRVPVLRIPEGTLLFSLCGTPDRLAHLTMADDAGPLLEGLEVGHLPRLMTFPVCLMLGASQLMVAALWSTLKNCNSRTSHQDHTPLRYQHIDHMEQPAVPTLSLKGSSYIIYRLRHIAGLSVISVRTKEEIQWPQQSLTCSPGYNYAC